MEEGELKRVKIALLLALLAAVPVVLASGITANGSAAAPAAAPSSFRARAPSNRYLDLIRTRAPWLTGTDLNSLASALDGASRLTGLPEELLLAMIEVESAYRVQARSTEGAIGLMQVKPIAAAEVGMDPERLHDPYWNVVTGALYLDRMRRTFSSLGMALAAYAAGPGNVVKGTVPRWYVQEVKRRLARVLEDRGDELLTGCPPSQ